MNFLNLLISALQYQAVNDQLVKVSNQIAPQFFAKAILDTQDYRALEGKELVLHLSDLQRSYRLDFIAEGVNLASLVTAEQGSASPQAAELPAGFTSAVAEVAAGTSNPIGLEVTINTTSLKALISKETDLDTLLKLEQVNIKGDQQLIISLINLNTRLDLSPESVLSKFVGDVPAYFLARAGEKASEVATAFFDLVGINSPTKLTTDESAFRDDSLEALAKASTPAVESNSANSALKTSTPLDDMLAAKDEILSLVTKLLRK